MKFARAAWSACILSAACGCLTGCDSPIGSQATQAVESYVSWTPEAIEKDPKGYLRHMLQECDRVKSEIEARRITLRKEESKLRAELAHAESSAQRLQEQLDTYKEAYRTAESSEAWPANVNGLKLSQAELRTLVLDKSRDAEEAKSHLTENPDKIVRIENRLADLDAKESQVDDAKVKTRNKLDAVAEGEVYASVEEIEVALTDLDAAPDSVDDGTPAITTADVEGAAKPRQAEFEAIMAE